MKLYLVPFRQEAKLLTAVLPNCRQIKDSAFSGEWEYNGGRIVCWNQAGSQGVAETINKFSDFNNFSEVILFGSAGSLAQNLVLGQVYSCTVVKNTNGKIWEVPQLPCFQKCGLLTTDALVFDNDKRFELYQNFGCELVDMEAAAFAEIASSGTFGAAKYGIIRFISDTYEVLPDIAPATNNFTGKFPQEIRQQIAKNRKNLI